MICEAENNGEIDIDTRDIMLSILNKSTVQARNTKKLRRGNSYREPEVKGKYKTTNGLKESVLEEIYEAELCGDITPEERQSLIDYMNI